MWDPDGQLRIEIQGDEEYKQQVQGQLDEIAKTPEGAAAVQQLEDSSNTHTIRGPNSSSEQSEGRFIDYDPAKGEGNGGGTDTLIVHDPTAPGARNGTPTSGLAHELGHAELADKGTHPTTDQIGHNKGALLGGVTPRDERNAMRLENAVKGRKDEYYPDR
jgi:hypothetical protein